MSTHWARWAPVVPLHPGQAPPPWSEKIEVPSDLVNHPNSLRENVLAEVTFHNPLDGDCVVVLGCETQYRPVTGWLVHTGLPQDVFVMPAKNHLMRVSSLSQFYKIYSQHDFIEWLMARKMNFQWLVLAACQLYEDGQWLEGKAAGMSTIELLRSGVGPSLPDAEAEESLLLDLVYAVLSRSSNNLASQASLFSFLRMTTEWYSTTHLWVTALEKAIPVNVVAHALLQEERCVQ